jgi:hypothetical protein
MRCSRCGKENPAGKKFYGATATHCFPTTRCGRAQSALVRDRPLFALGPRLPESHPDEREKALFIDIKGSMELMEDSTLRKAAQSSIPRC